MDSHISQAWTVIPLLLLLGPAARLVETLKPTNKVVPSCPPEVTTCEFHFVIRYNITMMKWVMADDTNSPDVMLPVVVGNDGQFYAKRKDCSGEDPLTKQGKRGMVKYIVFLGRALRYWSLITGREF